MHWQGIFLWAKNVLTLDEATALMTPQRDQATQTPCPSRRHPKCCLSPIPTLQNKATESLGPSHRCLSAHQGGTLSRLSPIQNQRNNASQSLGPSHRDCDHCLSAHQATLSHISPMQVGSENSDQSIDQISQEIQTLERIANPLNHLYSLHDKLVHRGDSNS